MIYLNCAATSYKRPQCVVDAVSTALCGVGNSGRGASPSELAGSRLVFQARENIASILGFSHSDRICFTANATEALNRAILGIVRAGDHVVATDWDHNSVLRPLHRLEDEQGVLVDYVRSDTEGNLVMEDFERLVTDRTKLVCVSHQSNLTGNICNLQEISRMVHDKGALLLVDAAQSAGAVRIDMDAVGIDVLCFTGHKALFGPQGTGGLAVAPHVVIESVIEGGSGIRSFERRQPAIYPEHLEAGTLNTHGLAGLAASSAWIHNEGLGKIQEHDQVLLDQFLEGISSINDIEIYGNFTSEHGPVLSLNLPNISSASVADILAYEFDIATRAGAHCAPRMHQALGTAHRGAVRFSWNFFTTEDDIQKACCALREIAQR